jgi:hypothetical protein
MSKKSYTFEDWLDVKVVLNTTKGIPNEVSEENIVSINAFNSEETNKIQEKQKSIFNELLDKEFEKIKNEFYSKIEISQVSKLLRKRELESLKALIGNKFICENGICRSPIKGDNKTFLDWYYRSMMNHKNNSIVSGIVRSFDEIPSPNSRFYENGMIPPEVMISAVLKMSNLLQKMNTNPQKRGRLTVNLNDKNKEKENFEIITNNDNAPIRGYEDWNRFFINKDAYDFFLDCKKELGSRGKKGGKTEIKSELTKYSNIFHFFTHKNLIHEGTKHKPFIKYLLEKHNAIFPPSTSSFPVKYSDADRRWISVAFKIWFEEK